MAQVPAVLHIDMPEKDDFGPKMQALSERERTFVVAWFHTGSREKATMLAGYAHSSDNVLRNAAWRVWHRPRVQEAIREFAAGSVLMGGVPSALHAILEIAQTPGHKDQAKAAAMILDRTGFHPMTESKSTVVHEVSGSERMRKFIAAAKALGKDPKELLGQMSDVTDAEFEEINLIQIEDGRAGLEDLL